MKHEMNEWLRIFARGCSALLLFQVAGCASTDDMAHAVSGSDNPEIYMETDSGSVSDSGLDSSSGEAEPDSDSGASGDDQDGDGVVAGADCNDNDASVHIGVYEDLDGDGDASTVAVACIGDAEMADYAALNVSFQRGRDCNDADPRFARFRPDVMGDGIDQNCNGIEEAAACKAAFSGEACVIDPPESSCESGVDLAVQDFHSIDACGVPGGGLVLANIGDLAYSGPVVITYGAKGQFYPDVTPAITDIATFETGISLAAGEQVYIETNRVTNSISVLPTQALDCDTDNNVMDIGSWMNGHCE
jgi:hypothetical protein